jgi:hypothetical protein
MPRRAIPPDERSASRTVHRDEDSNAAWETELARRADEIRTGQAVGEPAEKVFAELRSKYS